MEGALQLSYFNGYYTQSIYCTDGGMLVCYIHDNGVIYIEKTVRAFGDVEKINMNHIYGNRITIGTVSSLLVEIAGY